jgi:sialidase-1
MSYRLIALFAVIASLAPLPGKAQIDDGAHADIIRHLTVYASPGEYCAWPSIARTREGDILVFFARSEEHLGPDAAILIARSTDNGASWSAPSVLLDTPIDDREAGITVLGDGRLLAHLWSTFHTRRSYEALAPGSYGRDLLARWISAVETPEYRKSEALAGPRSALSSDGGVTWRMLERGHDSVHGGLQLAQGGLLVASYRSQGDGIAVYAADSAEGAWRSLSVIHSVQPESLSFGEPHMLQLPTGRVIMMIRATAHPYDDRDPRCVLWETYSDDGGRTWVQPFATPLWGFPPHLTLLSDGRVLCTYGYRRPPFGERACVSADGIGWDAHDELILRDDAPNGDLGYPVSIELEPGVILSVYYQPDVAPGTVQQMHPPDPGRTKPGILGTVWRAPSRR